MRRLAVVASMLGALCWCSAAQAQAAPRAVIAFLPYQEGIVDPAGMPLLDELARRGMAVGLTSPTLGGYSDRQMALDVSQGARVAAQAYDLPIEPFDLVPVTGGRGQISRFDDILARAERAPGEVVPGLLTDALARAGHSAAYAGVVGQVHHQAVIAAGREGRVARAGLFDETGFGAGALRLWRDADLLVARLPADERGLAVLDLLLAARRTDDLVYVVRSPGLGRLRLLETGVAGLSPGAGAIASATTRRPGLVSATDVAPSVLQRLGAPVPAPMQGRPLEAGPGPGPERARALADRLGVIVARRGPAVAWSLGAWLVLLAALVARRGATGARAALRILFLAALWSPGVLLVTAALAPPRLVEMLVLSVGSLALGAAADRLVRWPLAPALPALAVFGAHALDLLAGSPLVATSLAGPNPMGGARYYGIGNELEAMLSVSVLVGAGAGLSAVAGRRVAVVFGLCALLAAGVLGAGRLGADVGAVITLGAGAGVAILALGDGRPSWPALALSLAAPLVALAALVAVDLLTGGGAHLTRSVLEAQRPSDVLDIAERRFRLSLSGLASPGARVNTAVAVALIVAGVWKRRQLLAPLDGASAFRAGLAGALAATIVGAVANDSGPVILLLGTVALLLAVGYVQARDVGPGLSPKARG